MHLLLQSMYIILKVSHDADSHSMMKSQVGSRRAVLACLKKTLPSFVCYLPAASAHGNGNGLGPSWGQELVYCGMSMADKDTELYV